MSDSKFRLEKPPHPGSFVKTEIIDPLGLSVKEAANVLGITRQALSIFLNGQSDLSPEMAIRIDKAFGISMETRMRMQNTFDIVKAKARAGEVEVKPYQSDLVKSAQPGLFEKGPEPQ